MTPNQTTHVLLRRSLARRAIAVVSSAAAATVMITCAAFGQPAQPVDPAPHHPAPDSSSASRPR